MILYFTKMFVNFVINIYIQLLKLRGLISKSDTVHTDIEINGPELVDR